jgi:hypothetical protein
LSTHLAQARALHANKRLRQAFEKTVAIVNVRKHRLARLAARQHVIRRTGKLETERAGHGDGLRQQIWQNKT